MEATMTKEDSMRVLVTRGILPGYVVQWDTLDGPRTGCLLEIADQPPESAIIQTRGQRAIVSINAIRPHRMAFNRDDFYEG